MTPRERQASAGATLAPRPALAPSRAGAATDGGERPVPLWEDLYHSVPPTQQSELLALAARQGLLYAHQLPTFDPTTLNQRRQLLPQLLNDKVDLAAVCIRPVDVIDEGLDAAQREAVARALQSPDVCLIQGLPGSGKSRVLAEVVTQAATRGERVLLLSPSAAGIDRVLEFAGRREVLCPVRCVGRDERPETLVDWVRSFTFEERVKALRETALQAARADARASRERLDRLRAGLAPWDELDRLASSQALLDAKLANVARRRDHLAEDVQHAWAVALSAVAPDAPDAPLFQFQERVLACRRERDQGRERVEAEQTKVRGHEEELRKERQRLQQDVDANRPVVEARQGGRWWQLAWWRGLFRKDLLVRHIEQLERLKVIEQEEGSLKTRSEKLDADRARQEERFEQKRRGLLEIETDRRRLELDREEAELRLEADLLRRQWNEARAPLGDRAPRAEVPTAEATEWRAAWLAELAREEGNCELTRRWADCLEEAAATFPARLTACANLVVATTAGLAADPHFGEHAVPPITFDLLVLDEADRVTEAELLSVARRARRWVLVGEPAAPTPATAPRPGSRTVRGTALRPGVFQRLWNQLHSFPSRLPFAWIKDTNRLRCRLRPLAAEQLQWVENEPVADRPEVELRILVPPRGEPGLVEVCFPAETPIHEAKEFIFKELQEVAAHCRGYGLVWHEDAASVALRLGGDPDGWAHGASVVGVRLDEGVQEFVRPTGPTHGTGTSFETLGFEFDRRAGWTRARAEEWVRQRLGLRDLGRTVFLGRLRRARCGLSVFVADVLFRDTEHVPPWSPTTESCPGRWGKWSSVVEFVAVPPGESLRSGRHEEGHAGRGRPPRGGAGFELDVNDTTHPEHLPASLRAALPSRGLVNYFEAQAVVQALETLLADPGFRADALAWAGRPAPAASGDQNGQTPRRGEEAPHSPALVVTALYSAQVQLIRVLVGQSRVLAQAGLQRIAEGRFRLALAEGTIEVLVSVPESLRQRECLALLLSLTRSHTHRAVALGEDPDWLPLTLTRPRGRLVLFGDAGTLARRTQWLGAVDHLDDVSAGRERELVLRLLDHLEGRSAPPAPCPVCASRLAPPTVNPAEIARPAGAGAPATEGCP